MSPTIHSPTLRSSWALCMDIPKSSPLKEDPHHSLTLWIQSTTQGGAKLNFSTMYFQVFIICPQNLQPGVETCPLTMAQFKSSVHLLCQEGLLCASLNLSKILRLESPSSNGIKIHLHDKSNKSASRSIKPSTATALHAQQSVQFTLALCLCHSKFLSVVLHLFTTFFELSQTLIKKPKGGIQNRIDNNCFSSQR